MDQINEEWSLRMSSLELHGGDLQAMTSLHVTCCSFSVDMMSASALAAIEITVTQLLARGKNTF